jgi:hypothetical protein
MTLKFDSRTWAGLSALVKALIRSAVQADPARALCTTSLRLVSRDENEMTVAEAICITHTRGRCDDISAGRSGIIPVEICGPPPDNQRLDKHCGIPGLRDKTTIPVSWLVESSCLPAQL